MIAMLGTIYNGFLSWQCSQSFKGQLKQDREPLVKWLVVMGVMSSCPGTSSLTDNFNNNLVLKIVLFVKTKSEQLGLGSIVNSQTRAGSLVQWLSEETHVQEIVSSNPTAENWMDHFTRVFCVKIVLMFGKTGNKQKLGWEWPFKEIFKDSQT